jgi:DNA repair protein RecO (recombination protein O)
MSGIVRHAVAGGAENASGMILRVRPLTESSLVVHWLTPELGRLATVARGARRPKSPLRGKLDVFFEAKFSFARSRRTDLHTLREVVVQDTHEPLRQDLVRLRQAAYAAALIEQATETGTPLPEVWELLVSFVRWICEREPRARYVLAFELRLLAELGLAPDLEDARLSASARELLAQLLRLPWAELDVLQPEPSAVRGVRQFLHGFLIYHLGRLAPGRAGALGTG